MSNKRSLQQSDIIDNSDEPKKKKRRLDETDDLSEDDGIDNESDIGSDEFHNEISGMLKFLNSLEVLKYSVTKLKATQQQYAKESIAPIASADALNSDDYNARNEIINKHKLWTHSIPIEILRMIFERSIFHPDYDRTVLNLIKVCKSWRDVIVRIDPVKDGKLFDLLWCGVIAARNMKHKFGWKDLVLIPKKYLSLIYNLSSYRLEEMSNEENIEYRRLCAASDGINVINDYDEDLICGDTNVPLYIQVLQHCPRLYSIELHGKLCKDIFIVLSDNGDGVNHIEFSYCECADFLENLAILGGLHSEGKALPNLKSISIDSGWIQFNLSLFCEYFTDIEEISLQKKYVDGDDLYVMFKNCTKLRAVTLWRHVSEEGDWFKAFKCLTQKHKAIEYIEIDSGAGFDDECCKLFLDKNACPKLKRLWLHRTQCTQEMIARLKEARKDIDVEMVQMDW